MKKLTNKDEAEGKIVSEITSDSDAVVVIFTDCSFIMFRRYESGLGLCGRLMEYMNNESLYLLYDTILDKEAKELYDNNRIKEQEAFLKNQIMNVKAWLKEHPKEAKDIINEL